MSVPTAVALGSQHGGDVQSCEGNAAVIGLCIRVGCYLCGLGYSAALVRYFLRCRRLTLFPTSQSPGHEELHMLPSKLSSIAQSAALLWFALFVSFVHHGVYQLQPAEFLVVVHLINLLTAIMSHSRTQSWELFLTPEPADPSVQEQLAFVSTFVLNEVIMSAIYIVSYGFAWWFWTGSFHSMRCVHDTDEVLNGTYAFFFAKVLAFGWFRYLSIAMLIVKLLGLLLIACNRRSCSSACTSAVLGLVLAVLGAELTVSWNLITSVSAILPRSFAEVACLLLGLQALVIGFSEPLKQDSMQCGRYVGHWPAGVGSLLPEVLALTARLRSMSNSERNNPPGPRSPSEEGEPLT